MFKEIFNRKFRYNEETGMLRANVERDEKEEIPEWPIEKSLTGYVIKQNRPVLLRKNEILQLHKEGIIELIGTNAEVWLGVPLKVEDKILGAVVVQNYDNPDVYDQTSIEILEIVAHELSIFIDRQHSEDKANKLSRAVDQSSVSVMITNREGHIEYVNPFFTELNLYSFEEAKGKNSNILKSGHQSTAFYQELWNTILTGKNWEGEMLNKKKNGELYWEKAVISPIVTNQEVITNFVAIKQDITERKKMIEELVIAKEHAEESDRLKSAFLANMSHEIRTTMNGILGFSDLLKEPGLTREEQQEYISIIEKSGNRMLNIINEIVSISKIESGTMETYISETNINEQTEFVYNLLKLDAAKKKLVLTFKNGLADKASIINTDKEKFIGILANLVKNAIKYTDHGSIEFGYILKPTSMRDSTEQNGTDELEFYIKDTGIGIPKDRQEAIFERFIQADIIDKMARQGAGLGLTISRAYVAMLGGKIWVESEEGKGSIFYFTIPYHVEPEQKNITEKLVTAESETQIRDLKILIAEDDKTSVMLISTYVSKFAKEVLKVATGNAAVEICRKHPDIDLILMDIQMPDLNGYEATRSIREFNKDVVIIAQTAYAISGDREKAIEAGCNDYISKPIALNKLKTLIQKYFGK